MQAFIPGLEAETVRADDIVLTPDDVALDVVRRYRPFRITFRDPRFLWRIARRRHEVNSWKAGGQDFYIYGTENGGEG